MGMAPASMPPMAPPPVVAPTVSLPQRSLPPPPPMAAPTMMLSPVGSSRMPPLTMAPIQSPKGAAQPLHVAPTAQPYNGVSSSENDMKVLLDLAMASGSQQAVDAVLRQAQQQGVGINWDSYSERGKSIGVSE